MKTKPPPRSPTADELRAARERFGLTQTEAAALVYYTLNSWQRYESASEDSARTMSPAVWEYWKIRAADPKAIAEMRAWLEEQEKQAKATKKKTEAKSK